jgi:hypothetical protein
VGIIQLLNRRKRCPKLRSMPIGNDDDGNRRLIDGHSVAQYNRRMNDDEPSDE